MKFNKLTFEYFINSIIYNIKSNSKSPPKNSIGCFYNNKLFMLNKQVLSALFNNQWVINIAFDKMLLALTLDQQTNKYQLEVKE